MPRWTGCSIGTPSRGCSPTTRARPCAPASLHLLRAGWQPVYLDSAYLVLVRPTPATEAYRRAHSIDLRHAQPGDLVSVPSLRRQQEQNFAAFLAAAAPAPDEPTRQPTE